MQTLELHGSKASTAAGQLRERRESTARQLAQGQMLSGSVPLCGVIDLDTLGEAMASLTAVYPLEEGVDYLHAVAAKAITHRSLLQQFAREGFGCEVASLGELRLALAAGFRGERIIFDSPVKTREELREALRLGCAINADNFDELQRIHQLLRGLQSSSVIGLRINPQSGSGGIASTSTATLTSKFGIGLKEKREEIIRAFEQYTWLSQLHVHSGSQGMTLQAAAAGVAAVVTLAEEINRVVGGSQVRSIDIGGGLPVNFEGDEITPSFAQHRQAVEAVAPQLFNGNFRVITEFGRALTSKAGTLYTRVEYAKNSGGRRIALTHAGVQVATRSVYSPTDWPLRIEVFDAGGQPKTGPLESHDIAGPACFSGDLLAEGRMLPTVSAGDIIAVPDTGGYYFTTHYSYNALPKPAIYVTYEQDGKRQLEQLRPQQSVDQIVRELS